MRYPFAALCMLALSVLACGPLLDAAEGEFDDEEFGERDFREEAFGEEDLPAPFDEPPFTDLFDRYASVPAANGQAIPILIGAEVTDVQAAHAQAVLAAYLTDRPGTAYGADKAAISNAIADSGAVLFIFNTERDSESPEIEEIIDMGYEGQALFATEIHLDGRERDATYEEITHFVHVFGIEPAAPAMQAAIEQAMQAALDRGDYRPLSDLPREDWDDEYLSLGLEVYYGFWADAGEVGDDELVYATRAALQAEDPALYALIEGFFPPTTLD